MIIKEDDLMFFGAFTLLVLPLFLLVCVQMIKNSAWNDTVVGKVLIVLFYVVAVLAVGTAIYLFTQIGEDASTLQIQ